MQERHHSWLLDATAIELSKVTSLLHKKCRARISGLGFVIQGCVEVGALLQVFRGVALGVGFFAADLDAGTGWQGHGGRDSGRGNDGEEIEVHGGIPRSQLACLPGGAVKQT